jgi:hypothetical protein
VDPEESPTQSRNMAFGAGATPGLAEASQRQNMNVPHGFIADSVLHQIYPSGNAESPADYGRRLLGGGSGPFGSQLPTNNGYSPNTAKAIQPLVSKYATY